LNEFGRLNPLRIIEDLGSADDSARLIVGTRAAPSAGDDSASIHVPGLTSAEAAEIIGQLPIQIRENVAKGTARTELVFPLSIRREAAAQHSPEYLVFDEFKKIGPNPVTQELLAQIVASPEPLTLEDLLELSGDENAVALDGHLSSLSFLIVNDGPAFDWFTTKSPTSYDARSRVAQPCIVLSHSDLLSSSQERDVISQRLPCISPLIRSARWA
jgi:hypothetical protein